MARVVSLEGVPSTLAAARDSVDALLRDRGLRRTAPADTAESLLRGAHASAVLEGSSATLADLRDGAADDVALRAARLNADLLGLSGLLQQAPLQVFARLHTLAMAGAVPRDSLGRPRAGGDAAAELQGLARALLGSAEIPAVAVAALAHAQLLAAAPFESGNGLVARALERLVLVSRGVDPASVTVPEAGHLALRDDYLAAVEASRTAGLAGQKVFVLHAARALAEGVRHSPLWSVPEDAE